MIRFQCPHCGQKLALPDERAGRTSQCPGCKGLITIPASVFSQELFAAPPVPEDLIRTGAPQKDPTASAAKPSDALDRQLLDVPSVGAGDPSKKRVSDEEALAKLKFRPPPEYAGERELPWPIDILLYPLNAAGLINLAIVIGIPLLLTILQKVVFLPFLGLMFFLAELAVAIYAAWYWAECTWDSAQGGTRAPQLFDTAASGDKWSRVWCLLAVYGVFVLPATVYALGTGRRDVILGILVAWGIVFFPMGLLAMVTQDGMYVLNPLFLLRSIRRTFVPYLGLLLLIVTQAAPFGLVLYLAARQEYALGWVALALLTGGYFSLVIAHLLGRFSWRYRERLNWDA